MNDEERANWIRNDEGMYRAWKRSRIGLYRYIRKNREMIDKHLREVHHVPEVFMGKGRLPKTKPTKPTYY